MASLLKDLADKLDAADNNTTEPDDPNNAVEGMNTDDSLVDRLTVDVEAETRYTITIRR